MVKLKLLEQYEELVECDPKEMSYAWKAAMLISLTVCAASSYFCAALFYIFWHEICGGHCLFWAAVEVDEVKKNLTEYLLTEGDEDIELHIQHYWIDQIHVTYQVQGHCKWFHFHCLFSCYVSICLLAMFIVCGKGGKAQSLFDHPWLIVIPSLCISVFMLVMMLKVVHGFNHGLMTFVENLFNLSYEIKNKKHDKRFYHEPCEAFQAFSIHHNIYEYDSCFIFICIKMGTGTMAWTWSVCLLILFLRVITCADFTLLKIKIYEIPETGPEREEVLQRVRDEALLASRRQSKASENEAKIF